MTTPIRVAINGFGRIGRAFFRAAWQHPEVGIVAVNDLGDPANLAYLLKYDTAYGRASFEVGVRAGERPALLAGGAEVELLSERDPAKLPWKELGIDVAVESTGFFESFAAARAHLEAGAKRAVITAPAKDGAEAGAEGATVLMGLNEDRLAACRLSSNASCTTNAASPLLAILSETIGVEKALLNTVHAYTASQRIVDGPDASDFRRGRAGAMNIAPSSTGAAKAVALALPDLKDRFDGVAVRVPVVTGSLVDITFISKRETSAEEVNGILRAAAADPRWEGIFAATDEPLVSSDIAGQPYGSIADLAMTRVVGGNLVKVLAWYDNEMGYAHTLLRHVLAAGKVSA